MAREKLVRVWNNNVYDYQEKFKGQDIKIPANSYIEMNRYEAVEFKSSFVPPVYLKGGVPDPKHFKKIVVEEINDTMEEEKEEKKN